MESGLFILKKKSLEALAERDAKITLKEVRGMKLKSKMMKVERGSASLNISLEATDNLGITSPNWTPV